MLTGLQGIDISHWQGKFDFTKAKAQGKLFVIAKADDGEGGTDNQFERNREEAHDKGMIFGSYHFFHAAQDIDKQVDHYLKVIGKNLPNEFAPCIDWETTWDDKKISLGSMKPRALEFIKKIEKASGRNPIMYASPGWLEQFGSLKDFETYPLWIAHYGVQHPRVPKPWTRYTFWQYSEAGGLDLNVFNGSLEGLQRMTK